MAGIGGAAGRQGASAWAMLIVMGMSWGLSFSLARLAARAGVHPIALAFWEAVIAGLLLAAYVVAWRLPVGLSLQHIALYLVTGILGMVVPGLGFFYAAAHVSAGVLSIAVAIVPIITLVASALLRLERLEPLRVLGLGLGVAAIILLVGPWQSLSDPGNLEWVIIAFLSSSSYAALGILLALWKPKGGGTLTATCGMFCAASVLLGYSAKSVGAFAAFGWPWSSTEWSIAGLGLINAIAYATFFRLNDAAGPVFASQTANLITFFGVAWGIVLFGESHSVWVWLSFATMMVALALVRPRERLPA